MVSINLKKLISKKELAFFVQGIINTWNTPITILNDQEIMIVGDKISNFSHRYPIQVNGEVIGWVIGSEKVSFVAEMLSYLASQELEKKTLAMEMLDKYEEINLLYDTSEKIASCLGIQEIAELVIEEASTLIELSSASVMLLNYKTQKLEKIAIYGLDETEKIIMGPGEGIAGHVLLSGKAEIVNDVQSDSRYIQSDHNIIYSLICAPLTTHNGTIGVINITRSYPEDYTAQDLKLFTTLVSQAAAAIENAILHENKLKEERIKNNLERYLSPQVVQTVIGTKGEISLNTTKRNITVLFSDIRNFTTKCEELEPEKIVMYLNEYFTHMVSVIFSHQGTVNKFVGDMIMAIFGAPSEVVNRERKAIEAAIAMQRQIEKIPISWIRENFITGIGISSGEVVVGNIGSPQHMDYTAIGDEVNIAARLQSIAQGGQILCCQSVYSATKDLFEFRELGTVTVKGRKKAIETFEVVYPKSKS